MKILITVEFYYDPGGGGIAEQARRIAEGMAKTGHSVTVATSFFPGRESEINGVKIKGFRLAGNSVKGIKGEIENYKNFLKSGDFDIIINFAANVWTTDIAFEIGDFIKAKKILSTPGLSKLNDPRYGKYYNEIYLNALRKYDRIVYTSNFYRDKVFGDKNGFSPKSIVIPNGAGDEFLIRKSGFKEKYGISSPYLFLTVANHYFAKGHDFVIKAFELMKRNDAALVIIGNLPGRHSWYSCYPICLLKSFFKKNINILKDVPRELVISAFQESDIFLFGSKIECAPIVMYEAFASRTPFITKNVGNVSEHAPYLKIVNTPFDMAYAANQLLDNSLLKEELAEKAFNLWNNGYTWDIIADKYNQLINNI